MYWKFRTVAPDEVETEVTQRDQFRNDEIDLSDTVVREAVQNSLDAQQSRDHVTVRFAIADDSKGLDKNFLMGLFDDQLEHARIAGLDVDGALEGRPRALVIEDFGTRGLTGETTQKDEDNFSDFWRRHGKSHKSGKSGGRWGLGKLVYSYSSRVGAFFGLTIRDGDGHGHLMGQTVLNTHRLNGDHFAPHGFFADIKQDGPEKGLQVPVENQELRDNFRSQFSLQREMKSGLSVVVPYPRDEIDIGNMTAVGVTNYFFPVLTDQLVLEFDGTRVDRSSLRSVALEHAAGRIDDAELLFDFVEAAHALSDSEMLVLDTNWYDDWKLTEDDFDDVLLEDLRNRFAKNELIGIRMRVDVKRKDGRHDASHFDLFLKTDPDLSRGHDLYVRGGITVPGEAKFKHRKALGALVAKDGPISEFLGDAENAAHTKWNGRAEKLKNYKYAPQTLSVVRNSLVQLHDLLGQAVEEEAEDALVDFFWMPGDEGQRRKRGKKKPSTSGVPPIPRNPRPIRVSPCEGGFRVMPTKDAKSEHFPMRCRATLAYDIPNGNPFKRWQKFDFELGQKKGIPVQGKHVVLEAAADNMFELILESKDFALRIVGFDPERDVIVKLSTAEA